MCKLKMAPFTLPGSSLMQLFIVLIFSAHHIRDAFFYSYLFYMHWKTVGLRQIAEEYVKSRSG